MDIGIGGLENPTSIDDLDDGDWKDDGDRRVGGGRVDGREDDSDTLIPDDVADTSEGDGLGIRDRGI